jgi:RimJ/RimL family protein N-acetyltransferase
MSLPLPQPPLATTTLLLRPWRGQDVSVLLAAGHDPLISRYRYSLPRTPDAADEWIALTETDREDDRRLELALADGGVPVGSVSLTDLEHGNAMVRYWLLPEGRGARTGHDRGSAPRWLGVFHARDRPLGGVR